MSIKSTDNCTDMFLGPMNKWSFRIHIFTHINHHSFIYSFNHPQCSTNSVLNWPKHKIVHMRPAHSWHRRLCADSHLCQADSLKQKRRLIKYDNSKDNRDDIVDNPTYKKALSSSKKKSIIPRDENGAPVIWSSYQLSDPTLDGCVTSINVTAIQRLRVKRVLSFSYFYIKNICNSNIPFTIHV